MIVFSCYPSDNQNMNVHIAFIILSVIRIGTAISIEFCSNSRQ
jgi:hypothetical protein